MDSKAYVKKSRLMNIQMLTSRSLENSQINNDVHLCAPDTFDSLQEAENSSFADAMHKREEPLEAKNGTESPATGAHHEEESAIWNSHDGSEKNDFDSVGEAHEEIAKSMMTVLLPQPPPFLTYLSKKKRKREKVLKELAHEVKPEDKSSGSKPHASVASPGQPEMEVAWSSLGPAASILPVVPEFGE